MGVEEEVKVEVEVEVEVAKTYKGRVRTSMTGVAQSRGRRICQRNRDVDVLTGELGRSDERGTF